MTNSKKYDCLCCGIIVADHVCDPIDHLPRAGELVTSPRLSLSIGGCAANVAVDLARLRHSVGVVGVIGQDIFGRFVREFLEQAGVDCNTIVESKTEQTSGTLIVNVQGEDRRFIHTVGANAEFTAENIPADLLKNTRILYLGGYCLSETLKAENVAAMFREAQQAGVITLLDVVIPHPGEYWSRIEPVLK
ncbi:MAG: carbohydrate kinase family protein, partial [Planctomycetaceae bacterium]